MKVRVVVTVDVDPEVWAAEYGLARGEVRADVQRYCREAVLLMAWERGGAP